MIFLNRPLVYLVIFLLSLNSISRLHGQEMTIKVQQFGVEEGLLHRDIIVFKDSKGFLWLSSPAGLQRYDGYNFKAFNLPAADDFIVTNIGETQSGELWLLKNNLNNPDFFFLDPETFETSRESNHFDAKYVATFYDLLNQYTLEVFPREPSDEFYFQGAGKIIAFSFLHGSYEIPMPTAEDYDIKAVSDNGQIWVGLEKASSFPQLDATAFVPDNWNWTQQTSYRAGLVNGDLYMTTHKLEKEVSNTGVFAFSSDGSFRLVRDSRAGYVLNQVLDNRAWFTGEDGWLVINLITDERIELLKTDYGPELFGYTGYRLFYSDGPDRVYTCGPFGFNIIDIQPNFFTTYFNDNSDFELPFSNSIRGIQATEDQLFFLCETEGLVQQNVKDPADFKVIFDHSKKIQKYTGINLLHTANGDFWVPQKKYLHHYDSAFNLLEKIDFKPDFGTDMSWKIKSWVTFEDIDQCIWVADYLGLARICDGQLERFEYQGLPLGPCILQILQEDASTLWLCSQYGLLEFDIPTKKFTQLYASNQEGVHQLPATNIKHMLLEENGDKWLASDRGLIHWSAATGEKRLFTRLDGLSNNNLYAVYPDEHNRLWISSDYGIISFDKNSHHVNSYLPKDGIGQVEFNRVAHFQDADGRIYFGGLNGVTAFHPDDFAQQKEKHLNLVLSEFELFDGVQERLTNQLAAAVNDEVIEVKPADRYFKLSFSLPTFEDTEKILYGWKIEGVFDEWNYQKENFLQFAALPYGSHALRIKAQSSISGWSPHELTIKLSILKPFYLQFWFILLAILALAVATLTFFTYRTRLLRREIAKATKTIQEQTEELRQLDELKSRFFANVSHELRTPLALMLGPIRRLKASVSSNEEDGKLLGFLERNTIHLKGLVNEILDLSKLENNKVELAEEPTPIKAYLDNHLSQYYSIGNSESIVLGSSLHIDEALVVMLDRSKFNKVINNFLSNAIKFTPEGGQITLIAKDKEDHLVFEVKDSGRGIRPEDLPHVFDRFYQSKAKDAATEGGTGIGLSMCRELAELMQGEVWAKSEIGKGSSFYFKLPKKLAPQDFATTVEEPEQAQLPAPENLATLLAKKTESKQQKHQILVVEDNPDLRAYYEIILGTNEVAMCENGQKALDYLATNEPPDLIISDLMMPVMDGMQLLTRLKSDDAYRHLPFIMLTAKTNQTTKIEALRYGIDDYLTKPFDDVELIVRINNLLTNQAQRKKYLDEQPDEQSDNSPKLGQLDMEWLGQFEDYIIARLDDNRLSVSLLSREFAMSESTLLRQLKRLTGLTPAQYIRELRLNQARTYLATGQFNTISTVANKVGFKDTNAFSRSFKKRFGKTPIEISLG